MATFPFNVFGMFFTSGCSLACNRGSKSSCLYSSNTFPHLSTADSCQGAYGDCGAYGLLHSMAKWSGPYQPDPRGWTDSSHLEPWARQDGDKTTRRSAPRGSQTTTLAPRPGRIATTLQVRPGQVAAKRPGQGVKVAEKWPRLQAGPVGFRPLPAADTDNW